RPKACMTAQSIEIANIIRVGGIGIPSQRIAWLYPAQQLQLLQPDLVMQQDRAGDVPDVCRDRVQVSLSGDVEDTRARPVDEIDDAVWRVQGGLVGINFPVRSVS